MTRFDLDQSRWWTLWVIVMGSLVVAFVEVRLLLAGEDGLMRLVVVGATAGVAAFELATHRHTGPPLLTASIGMGMLALVPSLRPDRFDPGTTLAALILMALLFIATRQGPSMVPMMLTAGLLSVFTVLFVARETSQLPVPASFLLVGTIGQTTLIWMTWSLISSLSEASQAQTYQAQVHEALTGCSQALLARRGDDPIADALAALLQASAADYAYVDVNKTDADGGVYWEIIAKAVGAGRDPSDFTFDTGDYADFPWLIDRMNHGEVATLRVAELAEGLRQSYEKEGFVSEAMAPIMIGGKWVGTIGFNDSIIDTWADEDLYLLQRAAEMIAAYWEREHAREGLIELAKAKDRFIATVSHELRTPLAAVVGFADTLAESLEEFSEAEIGEMVGLIAAQGHEVADLVDDLLTAERAASGNLTVTPTVIDIRAECELVVAGYKTEFFVNIEGDAEAWADKLRTRQIIRNLLTNASRYGGEAVRIEISERAGLVSIAVFDSGSGIRALDAEHIFDPYFRSNKGESRTDSVGLGLAVARQLARIMGGDLEYQRREGWTCFELTLPVHQESSSRRQVAASA